MPIRISGNRPLKTLPGQETRPTASRVREALFNIWQGKIEDCRWLDLCAGSGAMGAEALCRGAVRVVGIEKSGRACEIIRQNWQRVAQPKQQFQILRGDILQQLPLLVGQQFDRIYFDPPYASGLYEPGLRAIADLQLLAPEGEIAIECNAQQLPGLNLPELTIERTRTYGHTALVFLQWQPITDQRSLPSK